MKCVFCNAWTEVLETRSGRRKRRCGNEHTFYTREVVESDIGRRDKQMADAVVLRGLRMSQVADQFGLKSDSYVSRVVRRHYPEYDARSAGQQRHRKVRK